MAMTPQQAFEEAYGASVNYTKQSLIGMGALKGAPCEIKSITPTSTGNIVTFKWVDDLGQEHTSTLFVESGYAPQVTVNTDTEDVYKLDITFRNEDGEIQTLTTPNLKGGVTDDELTPEQMQELLNMLV
jgi:hypothetical protein